MRIKTTEPAGSIAATEPQRKQETRLVYNSENSAIRLLEVGCNLGDIFSGAVIARLHLTNDRSVLVMSQDS